MEKQKKGKEWAEGVKTGERATDRQRGEERGGSGRNKRKRRNGE